MSINVPGTGQDISLVSVRPRLKTVGRGRSVSLASQERRVGEGVTDKKEEIRDSIDELINGTVLPPQLPSSAEQSPLRPTYTPSGQLVDRNICRQNLRRPNTLNTSSLPPPVSLEQQHLDNDSPDSMNCYNYLGPVQQLLKQQTAQRQHQQDISQPYSSIADDWPGPMQQQLDITNRDRQIAMVEEELIIARRLMEIKNKEQEKTKEPIGTWKVDDPCKLIYENGVNKSENGNAMLLGSDNDVKRQQDMFEQMEKARKEELDRLSKAKMSDRVGKVDRPISNINLTKQKVKEMLERKKREMSLSSSGMSSLKDAFTKNVRVCYNDAFNSDEDDEGNDPSFYSYSNKTPAVKSPNTATNTREDILASVLGEIPDQQALWEKIQREKMEEKKAIDMLKQNKLAQEQQDILDRILEQNEIRQAEEELSMRLIVELSLADQRDQEQLLKSSIGRSASDLTSSINSAPSPSAFPALGAAAPFTASSTSSLPVWWGAAASPPPTTQPRFEDWSVVGGRARERLASLKIASELDRERKERVAVEDWRSDMLEREEEKRKKQSRKLEENRKVRVVKSAQTFQEVNQEARIGHNFRDSLVNGNSTGEWNQRKKSNRDEGKRELGARRKSEGMAEFETERRKAAEELKERIQAQERELRARNEKEALEREWELAKRRKEKQTVGGLPQLHSKEKRKNQKKK